MEKMNVTMATVWKGDTAVAQYDLNELMTKAEMDKYKEAIKDRYCQDVRKTIEVDFVYREMKPTTTEA